ncbi:MAG: serine protease, partial [Rhizobiales bacterium 35-68-8]
ARGALVGGVSDNGPAAKAGIKAGDVVVRFDGTDVKEMRDLPRVVADTPVGREADVVVIRKGKEETLKITIARMPEDEKQAAASDTPTPPAKITSQKVLGIEVTAITDELKKRFKIKDGVSGVVILEVERNSAAADKGLKQGQVVIEVGQEPVASPEDVRKRIDALKKAGRTHALLLVTDADGQNRYAALPLN